MTSSAIGRTFLHSEGLYSNSDTEKLLLIQSISNEHKSGISGMPINIKRVKTVRSNDLRIIVWTLHVLTSEQDTFAFQVFLFCCYLVF